MSERGGARDVVGFWRLTELFTPQNVEKPDPGNPSKPIVDWAPGRPLPWPAQRRPVDARPKHGWVHTIYLGVYQLEAGYVELQRVFPEDPDAYDERPLGESACAAIVVDDAGLLLTDLAVLSSAVWGIGRLRRPGTADPSWSHGLDDHVAEFRADLVELMADRARSEATAIAPVDAEVIEQVIIAAQTATGISDLPDLATARVRIVSSWQSVESPPDPPFLNSFFLDDLALVAAQPWGRALSQYLTADQAVQTQQRVDVRTQPGQIDARTGIESLPLGRWLSNPAHPLATSQQFAVNEVMNELAEQDGILGVNGPPGTGKTTMLRDIVAGNVVRRAQQLSRLARPDDAFMPGRDLQVKLGNGQSWVVPRLKPEFVGFEMVVASSNNAAVANVSSELPLRAAVHDTWSAADYFGDLAGLTSRAASKDRPVDAWGLIAARLGNFPNRRQFEKALWYGAAASNADAGDEIIGLKAIFENWKAEGERPNWDEARQAFKLCQSRVERLKAERAQAEDRLRRVATVGQATAAARQQAENLHRSWQLLRQQQAEAGQYLQPLQQDARRLTDSRGRHRDLRPSWWAVAFSFGAAGRRWRDELRELNRHLDHVESAALDAGRRLDAATAELGQAAGQLDQLHQRVVALEHERAVLDGQLTRDAQNYGPCHPGPHWRNDDRRRELNGAWLDPVLNRARGDLFLAALTLHKAFLAGTRDIHRRMIAATKIVRGAVPRDLDPQVRLAGWQLFFLLVPLISTTFASAGRMFEGLGADALGWLLIDEAGQATPQAAVGAIWRAKRVVAVGDPMQLTPVVTLPRRTQEALAAHRQVSQTWIPGITSVQVLADRVGRWGTWLPGAAGDPVWVSAPLRVHRRCDNPMFDLSNAIAYDNLMINGVVRQPDRRLDGLPESAWLDVPARRGTQVQQREIDLLTESVGWLIEQAGVRAPEIIVISPFRKVSTAIKDATRRHRGVTAGTIHTAQGREAEVVILVLGGDPASTRSMQWAAGSPNLVNVAVSRAKRRLYVIGDRSVWTPHPYFSELGRRLPISRRSLMPPEEADEAPTGV